MWILKGNRKQDLRKKKWAFRNHEIILKDVLAFKHIKKLLNKVTQKKAKRKKNLIQIYFLIKLGHK